MTHASWVHSLPWQGYKDFFDCICTYLIHTCILNWCMRYVPYTLSLSFFFVLFFDTIFTYSMVLFVFINLPWWKSEWVQVNGDSNSSFFLSFKPVNKTFWCARPLSYLSTVKPIEEKPRGRNWISTFTQVRFLK